MESPRYVQCPACGQNHSPRRDGICPRCGAAAEARPGALALPAESAAGGEPGTGAGAHRLAGWMFVLLGLLGVAAGVFALQDPYLAGTAAAPRIGAGLASLVELVLGGLIVAGASRARTVAIALCVLGAVATVPIAAAIADRVDVAVAVLRLVFVLGSLLLLVGRPGAGRTAIGGLLVIAYALLKLRLAWGAAMFRGRWSGFWQVWQ